MSLIKAKAWNNGAHHKSGAGYGLKVPIAQRDEFFQREWQKVELIFSNGRQVTVANIDKDSFWNDQCHELISSEIGQWLIQNKLAPWPKGKPPEIRLLPIGGNRFEVLTPVEQESRSPS